MKLKTQQQKPQKVVQVEMWYEIHVIKKNPNTTIGFRLWAARVC